MPKRSWTFFITLEETVPLLLEIREKLGVSFLGQGSLWKDPFPPRVVEITPGMSFDIFGSLYLRLGDGPAPNVEFGGFHPANVGWVRFRPPRSSGNELSCAEIETNTGRPTDKSGVNRDLERFYGQVRRFFGKVATIPVFYAVPANHKIHTTQWKCSAAVRRFVAEGGRIFAEPSAGPYLTPDPPQDWGPATPMPRATGAEDEDW